MPKRSVKSPIGGSNRPARSMTRTLQPREVSPEGTRESRAARLTAKATEGAEDLEEQAPRNSPGVGEAGWPEGAHGNWGGPSPAPANVRGREEAGRITDQREVARKSAGRRMGS